MLASEIWKLDYCVPTVWTLDTRPPPAWEQETELTIEEAFSHIANSFAQAVAPLVEMYKHVMISMSRQYGKSDIITDPELIAKLLDRSTDST